MKRLLTVSAVFIALVHPAISKTIPFTDTKPKFYAITVNGHENYASELFLRYKNELLVSKNTLKIMGFEIPNNVNKYSINDDTYYSFSELKYISYKLEKNTSKIEISAQAEAFPKETYNLNNSSFIQPTPIKHSGLLLNYDLFSEHSSFADNQASALFQAGIFTPYGVAENDFIVRNNVDNNDSKQFKAIRLSTYWRRDFPDDMSTLRLGDSITSSGGWGNSMSFAGIQYSRNFASQPFFTPFPLPVAKGLAALPSTVDVYLNNNLVQKQNVNGGPFTFNNLPVITGNGDVQVVITNILGQQQVINVPYYASTSLLRPGLSSFSFSAGWLREDYGIKSFDYEHPMFSATYSEGIYNNFTLGGHSELSQGVQNIGLSGAFVPNNYGEFLFSVAGSRSESNTYGTLISARFQRQARFFNFGISTQYASSDFKLLSSLDGSTEPQWQNQVFFGLNFKHYGSFGASVTQQVNRDNSQTGNPGNLNLLSLNYSNTFLQKLNLSVSAISNLGGESNKSIFVTLSIPFGSDINTYAQSNWQAGSGVQSLVGIQKNLPIGDGYGYTVQATPYAKESDNRFISARGDYQNKYGTYRLGIGREGQATSYQAQVQGSLVWLDGYLGLSRTINDSFALVKTPDLSDIPVYWENQKVGVTNSSGEAFIPNLISYNKNHISLDPSSLPLGLEIKNVNDDVVPYFRSGNVVKFGLHKVNSGIMTIKLKSGEYLPLTATVYDIDNKKTYPVGYDGKVFFKNITDKLSLLVDVKGKQCQLSVSPRKSTDNPVEDLGTYTCDTK